MSGATTSPRKAPKPALRVRASNWMVAGIVGGITAFAANALGMESWAVFLMWTAYGMFGNDLRDGMWLLICFCVGLVSGYTVEMVTAAAPAEQARLVGALAVGAAVVILSALGSLSRFDSVHAFFIGSITQFALFDEPAAPGLLFAASHAALGLFAGWLTWAGQQVATRLVGRKTGSAAATKAATGAGAQAHAAAAASGNRGRTSFQNSPRAASASASAASASAASASTLSAPPRPNNQRTDP